MQAWSISRLREALDPTGPPDKTLGSERVYCPTPAMPCEITDMAVDSSGALWVAAAQALVASSPKTLALDGGPGSGPGDLFLTTPAALQAWNVWLDAGPFTLVDYRYDYLAFDSAGNLWVTASSLDELHDVELLEFTKEQLGSLATNPTPTPLVAVSLDPTLPGTDGGLPGPLAFDAAGNLWISPQEPILSRLEFDAGVLLRFAPGTEVDGRPDRVFIPPGPWPSLAFSPIPAGLPSRP